MVALSNPNVPHFLHVISMISQYLQHVTQAQQPMYASVPISVLICLSTRISESLYKSLTQ
jgi:hypothetical protein